MKELGKKTINTAVKNTKHFFHTIHPLLIVPIPAVLLFKRSLNRVIMIKTNLKQHVFNVSYQFFAVKSMGGDNLLCDYMTSYASVDPYIFTHKLHAGRCQSVDYGPDFQICTYSVPRPARTARGIGHPHHQEFISSTKVSLFWKLVSGLSQSFSAGFPSRKDRR